MSRDGSTTRRTTAGDPDLATVLAGLAAGALISFTLGTSVAIGTLLGGAAGQAVAWIVRWSERAR